MRVPCRGQRRPRPALCAPHCHVGPAACPSRAGWSRSTTWTPTLPPRTPSRCGAAGALAGATALSCARDPRPPPSARQTPGRPRITSADPLQSHLAAVKQEFEQFKAKAQESAQGAKGKLATAADYAKIVVIAGIGKLVGGDDGGQLFDTMVKYTEVRACLAPPQRLASPPRPRDECAAPVASSPAPSHQQQRPAPTAR